MQRWNGWGDDAEGTVLPVNASATIKALVGPGTPVADASLESVVASVPASRIADGTRGCSTEPEDRIRHARGQSLPDWIALRSGRLGAVPDAVARPADGAAVRDLLDAATTEGWRLIPFGGGTSVVGGVTVRPSERPVVSVDLSGIAGLRDLDATSGLATFGAGTVGPEIEAALGQHGRTLGHFPQSFEWSTLGGWVAARSAGQESAGYGRIERLFAGGRLEAPAGSWDLPTHPASAAGPDLREVVLGSEGRLGILTDLTVRTVPRRERDIIRAYSAPDWEAAVAIGRELAASGLPLSMVRISTPMETQTLFTMAGDTQSRRWLQRYLRWRGRTSESCLVLVGIAGAAGVVKAVEGEVARILKAGGAIGLPGVGPAWRRDRFHGPYLRNALWDAGYAVDTMETAVDWARLPTLAAALAPALRSGLETEHGGERVHAFTHLSHLYPSGSSLYATYIFRIAADPAEMLARWRRLKTVASEVVVAHGGTISHQHGIGTDHAPYLAAEKGPLGMGVLEDLVARFDPSGVMHRGVLLEDDE